MTPEWLTRLRQTFKLRRQRLAGWAAIDFSDGLWGVRIAPPQSSTGKPRVVACAGLTANSYNPDELDDVRSIVSAIAAPGYGLASVLRMDEYTLMLNDRPTVKPEEMEQSLRWSLESRLDYPSSEACLSWFDLPLHESTANRPQQHFVAAARRALIDERIAAVERGSGITLDAIDIRETARRNMASLIEEQTQSAVVLLVAEPNGLQVTVTHGGELFLERFVREKLLSRVDSEARQRQLDRVALEIQRTLDFMRRNFAFMTIKEVWLGPLEGHAELIAELSERFSEPLRSVALSELIEWDPSIDLEPPEQQRRFFTAIGAALRYRDSSLA